VTEDQIDHLSDRIHAGERPTLELWTLRRTATPPSGDNSAVEALSDLWGLAFHISRLFPPLEAAKALVDLALLGGASYPILTNEGLIYDALSLAERAALVEYIEAQAGEKATGTVLWQFADDLLGSGP
jgi:hypothetical protein